MADEMERNSFNLRQLFEKKFEACVDKQEGLFLNVLKDKESKRLLLEYMSNPIVAQFFKSKIRSDPIIQEVCHILCSFISASRRISGRGPTPA